MEFLFADSSNVVSAKHDGMTTMHITYKKAGTYRYDGVPKVIFERLIKAASPGKYIHANVRDLYQTTKVEE
jgi:hypothetical protein